MANTRWLPQPVTPVWDWQLRGSCRGMDSEAFFYPEGERGLAKLRREAAAKVICGRCPVLDHCRRYALAVREQYGVWGGLTPGERMSLHTDRPTETNRPTETSPACVQPVPPVVLSVATAKAPGGASASGAGRGPTPPGHATEAVGSPRPETARPRRRTSARGRVPASG